MTSYLGISYSERYTQVQNKAKIYANRYSDWPEEFTLEKIQKESDTYYKIGCLKDYATQAFFACIKNGYSYNDLDRVTNPATNRTEVKVVRTVTVPGKDIDDTEIAGYYRLFVEEMYRKIKIESAKRQIRFLYQAIEDKSYCWLYGIFRKCSFLIDDSRFFGLYGELRQSYFGTEPYGIARQFNPNMSCKDIKILIAKKEGRIKLHKLHLASVLKQQGKPVLLGGYN